MIKKRDLLFVAIAVPLLSACEKDSSPTITQSFELGKFTGINLSIAGKVRIVKGTTQKVEVTGPEETVYKIFKEVKSGIWNIRLPSTYLKRYDKLAIVITSNNLEKLEVSGSGTIVTEDALSLSVVNMYGSGNIDVRASSSTLESEISGSGTISVSGYTGLLQQHISGSGNFRGFTLEAFEIRCNSAGSGDAEVFSTTKLDVTINGSGNVYYKGKPLISIYSPGSGELINAN